MAIVQLRHDTPGRAYYRRRLAEGKTPMEAIRALKRHLSDVVYPADDPRRASRPNQPDGSGRTHGSDSAIQRGQLNPDSQLFGQVTPRTRYTQA
jgi:transposase